jgi:hypothetical protein
MENPMNPEAIRERSAGGFSQATNQMQPSKDFIQYLQDYARQKPDVAALWCFGLGFIVGWKLKPW